MYAIRSYYDPNVRLIDAIIIKKYPIRFLILPKDAIEDILFPTS